MQNCHTIGRRLLLHTTRTFTAILFWVVKFTILRLTKTSANKRHFMSTRLRVRLKGRKASSCELPPTHNTLCNFALQRYNKSCRCANFSLELSVECS